MSIIMYYFELNRKSRNMKFDQPDCYFFKINQGVDGIALYHACLWYESLI